MIEIRIFYEKLDGRIGHLVRTWKAKTPEELMKKWFTHLDDYEGNYYEVVDLDKNEVITDWVYDPDDYLIIGEYFGYSNDQIMAIYNKHITLTSYWRGDNYE